jgi:Serine dehydrogenase proteinase
MQQYQARHGCHLAVMIDQFDPDSATLFAELLHGTDPDRDLHLILRSRGGDGEVAVRLARMAQAACRRFVVVVPDMAKSAATIFALGAHEIVMGPPSDLGPIDPQVFVPDHGYVSAKEIMSAVDRALKDVSERPDSYPLHSALLGMGNVDATLYEFAKSALDRTGEIAKQAITSNPDIDQATTNKRVQKVTDRLITKTHTHSAVVGCAEARQVGLPVTELDIRSEWWQEIWAIWTRYFALGPIDELRIYESESASQVHALA